MRRILLAAIVCIVTSMGITSCQENQRQKYYDKIQGDVTGAKLKGYAVYYEIDFSDYSYYMSDEQYPVYKDEDGYYIKIDGEEERLYKLDDPVYVNEYKSFKYVTDGNLYIESIPSGY